MIGGVLAFGGTGLGSSSAQGGHVALARAAEAQQTPRAPEAPSKHLGAVESASPRNLWFAHSGRFGR
jgi:hypothetical protein